MIEASPEFSVRSSGSPNADTSESPSLATVTFVQAAVLGQIANVQLCTNKELTVMGSMIDCQATLGGPLRVNQCVAGGRIVTSDTVHVATLGGPNHPTALVLGTSPKGNALITRVPKQLESFDQQIQAIEKDLAYISNHGTQIGHNARERVMELEFELGGLEEKRATLQKKYEDLLRVHRDKIRIKVLIEEVVHAGVVIEHKGRTYQIDRQIDGPVNITCDANSELIIAHGDQTPQRLTDYLVQSGSGATKQSKTHAA